MTIAEERYYANVARIARALERIADKLEGKAAEGKEAEP